jgi:hypothetical protein
VPGPDDNDFYEDDEPLEDVRAAFEAGERGTTAPPPGLSSRTVFFDLRGYDGELSLGTQGDADLVRVR